MSAPNSDPSRARSSRSKSPADRWVNPKEFTIFSHCVPLPAPIAEDSKNIGCYRNDQDVIKPHSPGAPSTKIIFGKVFASIFGRLWLANLVDKITWRLMHSTIGLVLNSCLNTGRARFIKFKSEQVVWKIIVEWLMISSPSGTRSFDFWKADFSSSRACYETLWIVTRNRAVDFAQMTTLGVSCYRNANSKLFLASGLWGFLGNIFLTSTGSARKLRETLFDDFAADTRITIADR